MQVEQLLLVISFLSVHVLALPVQDKRAVAYCAGSPIAQEGNKRAVAYCDGNPEALEQPTKRGVSYYRHHLYWDTKEEKKRSVSSYGPHTFWDAKEEK